MVIEITYLSKIFCQKSALVFEHLKGV